MYSRFKQLILEIHQLPFPEQEKILHERFEQWKGVLEQVDDVLVAGFRLH